LIEIRSNSKTSLKTIKKYQKGNILGRSIATRGDNKYPLCHFFQRGRKLIREYI
jgi:hypothetical protein